MDKLMSLAVVLAIPVFLIASWLANTKPGSKFKKDQRSEAGASEKPADTTETKLSDDDMTSP